MSHSRFLTRCACAVVFLRLFLLNQETWRYPVSAHQESRTSLIQSNSSDANQTGDTNLFQLLNTLVDEPLSTRLLAGQFKKIFSSSDENDWNAVKLRCHRYGTTPLGGGQRRKIFVGSLLADESWLTILNSAIESYGIYHYFVFVESNQTQNSSPRNFRYQEGSPFHQLITGGIFGPETLVQVKQHIWESFNFPSDDPMTREFAQRERILEFWIENGMTPNDIGIIEDADETFSRDFLLAAQSCDFRELRPDADCALSRISARAMYFRGDFTCMQITEWFKPQMLIGHCFNGVGNSSKFPSYPRSPEEDRLPGFGWNDDYSSISEGPFPLYTVQDCVRPCGSTYYPYGNSSYAIAYHFSNFFDTAEVYRFKFGTYGHADPSAFNTSFEKLNKHIEMMLNCAKHTPHPATTYITRDHLSAPASFAETDFIIARQQEVLAFIGKNN